jgi:radical SAM superfamily enzyme YgiQ (UPF0313 family)
MFAIILSVPRIAAVRPAAAPSIIKSLLKKRNLESKIFDINLDFHNSFRKNHGEDIFWSLDDYFFNDYKQFTDVEFQAYETWMISWIEKIKIYNPKWLMISVFTWQAQRFTRDFLKLVKKHTNIPVIIGGQGLIKEENGSYGTEPIFAYEMKESGLISHWVRGEIETTIDSIITETFSSDGIDSKTFAKFSNPNEHEYMNFDDFDITRYHSGYETGVLPMETSRGCVRNCMFCDIPTMHGGYRYKKGERLFNEMIHYHEKYKVNDFFFHDALCNGSVKDFRIFNNKLVEYYKLNNLQNRYLKYSSHYIIRSEKLMPERDFELMGMAGAETMVIGVESGSDKVRNDMRKDFTNVDLDYNMKMFSKYKINAYFLIIVGFPTETRQDFEQTLDMLKRYQPYVADGTIIGVNLGTTLTIEQGTPIYEEYDKFNIIGTGNHRPKGPDWICKDNINLTYKERILRRIEAQEFAIKLGYTFWKGDDQLKVLMSNYKTRLDKLAGVIH